MESFQYEYVKQPLSVVRFRPVCLEHAVLTPLQMILVSLFIGIVQLLKIIILVWWKLILSLFIVTVLKIVCLHCVTKINIDKEEKLG